MTIDAAREAAYSAASRNYFPGMQFRRDIALVPEESRRDGS